MFSQEKPFRFYSRQLVLQPPSPAVPVVHRPQAPTPAGTSMLCLIYYMVFRTNFEYHAVAKQWKVGPNILAHLRRLCPGMGLCHDAVVVSGP